ncbi:tRNA (adenosine(37)-N6)-threonylcarbamoyltransferase complex transferase subunit TsaD [Ruminococcaceae bacterium OttesenSCG-928-A16]|nr:tRNA (adenosine(37)-N6)-threonylcarbamoyltransferase complex transferase subunit TsaD [Ruminococcaceae bacterium OttesenSCG-928-A16]
MKILGIETSCDETAAAIVEDGRHLLANVIASSVKEQALYGGVVPEIASRRHIESISMVAQKALDDAGLAPEQLAGIAVTYAPGLIGALLVGVNFAKGLAFAAQKPLIPVHHLRGHIAALYLTHPGLQPPFLCLVASGGHCHFVQVNSTTSFAVLGRTVDDAAGEAFDKVARTLGLGYPGGPAVSKAAQTGSPTAYKLPTPHVEGPYNVSFSGLKTAVLNVANNAKMKNEPLDIPGLAASFEHKVADILATKLAAAARDTGATTLCLAGGVAANTLLRQKVQQQADLLGAELCLPKLAFCGDNAAMIAAQGYFELQAGHTSGWNLNGYATMPIEENYSDITL